MANRGTTATKTTNKKNKNPYTDLGRDKFSALLAQVEEKKKKIFSQVSPEEVSSIRFKYSSNHKLKPVVVMAKGKSKGKVGIDGQTAIAEPEKEVKQKADAAEAEREAKEQKKTVEAETETDAEGSRLKEKETEQGKRESGGVEVKLGLKKLELGKLEPSNNYGYLIVIMILILLSIILFERYRSTLYLLEEQSRLLCQKMG